MANPYDSLFTQAKPADAAPAQGSGANPYDEIFAPAKPQTEEEVNPDRYSLGQVPGAMARNLFPSIGEKIAKVPGAISEGVEALLDHPGGVAKSWLSNIADIDKLRAITNSISQNGKVTIQDAKDFATAFGPGHELYKGYEMGRNLLSNVIQKYGSWDKAKTTAAEHPDEFLMDVASVLPMVPKGTGALATGLRGAAETADISRLPTTLRRAATVGGNLAGFMADHTVQMLEGIAPGALGEMVESGKEITPGVWNTLTKGLDNEAVYKQLQGILTDKFDARNANYEGNMATVKGATDKLDFGKVDAAVQKFMDQGVYKVPGDTKPGFTYEQNPTVLAAKDKIKDLVDLFKAQGDDYHTAFGFDKLKRGVQSIADGLKVGTMPTAGSKFANDVARSIRQTIIDNSPEYGNAMKAYESDSDAIEGLIKEFSLQSGNKLTTLRKLQKVFRNTADTGHGERTQFLRQAIEDTGDKSLMGKLAASQFNPWLPRGLRGTFLPGEMMLGDSSVGKALGWMAGSSPRIAGAAAYGLGRMQSLPGMRTLGNAMGQAYRGVEHISPLAARAARFGRAPDEEQGYFAGGHVKVSKSSVDYSRGMGATRCRNCAHFQSPDGCSKVRGEIDPTYWCELFKKRS